MEFDRTYTVKEVASILGVSYSTAYDLTRRSLEAGGIPAYKFGGSIRIKESDLKRWIDEQSTNRQAVR